MTKAAQQFCFKALRFNFSHHRPELKPTRGEAATPDVVGTSQEEKGQMRIAEKLVSLWLRRRHWMTLKINCVMYFIESLPETN